MKRLFMNCALWMDKRWTYFFLSLFALLEISAQNTCKVSGIVKGGDNETLVGANVVLKKGSEIMGTTTDSVGSYSISLPHGKYTLEVSFVGYVKYTTHVEVKGNVTLPPVVLNEDIQLMNEIVVTARTITYNTDGYVAEVHKNPLYRNMNMTSVLKMSPGTHATHNSIQAFGKTVSKIYLNGRELNLSGEQLIAYLETIDAKNVKAMEVIAASGVEEDATNKGKSIIKITTINPETGGDGQYRSGVSKCRAQTYPFHEC